jgi:peptide/nickel transport system permease protein
MRTLLARRVLQMFLIMLAVSALLFAIFDTEQFRRKLAVAELGGFGVATLSEPEYQLWLTRNGFEKPFVVRYAEWLGRLARGELGESLEKDVPVATLLRESLTRTAILALFVFVLMIPLALTLGLLAGVHEGTILDRIISFWSVITTSTPQIATAVLLTVILALGLRWVPAKSAMLEGFSFRELVLPVVTLLIYEVGYLARMTRAATLEVGNGITRDRKTYKCPNQDRQ